jgi:hypothetical protein
MKPEKRGWLAFLDSSPGLSYKIILDLLLDVVVTRMPPVRSRIV